MTRKPTISVDKFLAAVFALSVLQAVSINILKINLYATPLFLIMVMAKAALRNFSISKAAPLPLTLSIWLFSYTILIYLFVSNRLGQEFAYQLYSAAAFILFILIFSAYEFNLPSDGKYKYLKLSALAYLFISLSIHLTAWDQVAAIFYTRENDFGGLLMDGRIKRMYGLLFNPLASAFSCLILIITLSLLNAKDRVLYATLTIIIALSLSRSTIAITAALLLYIYSYRRTKLMTAIFAPVLSGLLIYFGGQIYAWTSQTILLDETGSISEHLKNYEIGFSHIFSTHGEGFRDARDFGAWNIRLESMPLQYALTGGIGLFFPFIALTLISIKKILSEFGLKKGATVLFIIPIIFSFPIHTFNLPITLFAFLLSTWALRLRVERRSSYFQATQPC